jgi:co-chaperonin GroES (HSP10)
MAIRLPRGRILVRLNNDIDTTEGTIGTVVKVGDKPLSPMGDPMGIRVQSGDRVHFRMMDASEKVFIKGEGDTMKEPHAVIDHYQVNLIESTED